ncbi:PLAC8 family-domain-containing protein [Biscogniauxia marginata]|nr:PLAC8 family-domain-containing protein [Biscogniauxia marginata]
MTAATVALALAANNMPREAPILPAFQKLQKIGGGWESGLFNCMPCGSCILGTFVPCLLIGRTSNRLVNPTALRTHMLDVDCLLHAVLTCSCGFGWILVMVKRTEIRTRFAIPGDELKDCCTAYWCQCCAIIQQDNEVKRRMPDPEKLIREQPQLVKAMSMTQAARP